MKRISSNQVTLALIKDVKNPKPGDRRTKRDWRKVAVWRKEGRFVVTTETFELKDGNKLVLHYVEPRGSRLRASADDYPELMAALQPFEQTLNDALGDYAPGVYGGPKDVIQQLVKNGTLSLKQIERAVAELNPDHTVLDSIVMAVDEGPQ